MIDININVYYSRCIMDRARNGTCTEIIKNLIRIACNDIFKYVQYTT